MLGASAFLGIGRFSLPKTPDLQLEWNPAPLDREEFLFRETEGSQQVSKASCQGKICYQWKQ